MKKRFNNDFRGHALCFQKTVTGQFYIELTMYPLHNYISGQVGNVHNSYILHSNTLNDSLETLKETALLDIIYGSADRPEHINAEKNSPFQASLSTVLSSWDISPF